MKAYAEMGYVQVELLQDVKYGRYDYPKGELLWIEPADAAACVKMGAARVVSQ
ncbi:hypothetical protein [Paenibacillus methanolicus]|nr:hypothetical protein [Paenibacillus methanolicus]